MTGRALGLVELILIFGIVIGWALWELWVLRRERRKAPHRRDVDP